MTKLIGTNPNQVPSNADLGTAAFMDKTEFLLSKGSSLSEIDAAIPKTAVDVFVYDTSKDSDGGAWRKRTKNTSWYNETLNTTTRGSRREFPAVAVIVAESNKVTIYDGDAPLLPMWMVFNNSSNCMIGNTGTIATIAMLNGELCVGRTSASKGLGQISFLTEVGKTIRRNSPGHLYIYKGNIEQRNDSLEYANQNDSTQAIQGDHVYDVVMTVLPNAPIDIATGLPVPTIAVATDGGVSVIKDDGSVVNLTGTSQARKVAFKNKTTLITSIANNTIRLFDNVGELTNSTSYNRNYYSDGNTSTVPAIGGVTLNEPLIASSDIFGITNKNGSTINTALTFLSENETNQANGMVAYISSDYNTGWMVGDIKLATLSDTSTSYAYDHSGITFRDSGRISSHTYTTGATSWTVTDDPSNGTEGYFGLTIPTEDGKQYTIYHTRSVLLDNNQQNHIQFINGPVPSATINWGDGTTDLSDTITFTAQGSSVRYVVYSRNNATTTHTINVTLAEQDRSVNGNGLQVFGNGITKTPVATGADLVAYGGFTLASYLVQPATSTMIDWSNPWISYFWFDTVGKISIENQNTSGYNNTVLLVSASATIINTRSKVSGGAWDQGISITNSGWTHVACVYTGSALEVYRNGIKMATYNGTLQNQTAYISYGVNSYNGGAFPSSWTADTRLALHRISATVPSAEQIKKIYEDEKFLFQDNAKATLYGTSDAVTALAYDDDTKLLHAGTSAGRSDFQGLCRINNTTRAVGTTISAVDGFIVEE
jgi:hypothetical protein